MESETFSEQPAECPCPLCGGAGFIGVVEGYSAARGILRTIAQLADVSVENILARNKQEYITTVRQFVAYYLREREGMSWVAIGRLLRRNHATIIHAHERVSFMLSEKTDRQHLLAMDLYRATERVLG